MAGVSVLFAKHRCEVQLVSHLVAQEECLVLCCVIAHCVGRDSHDHHHCQNHHLLHNRVSYILKYWCPIINNVKLEKGDILQLDYPDESFDKVVAANVIHLLDTPEKALNELFRVCRKGGEVIIPTYLVKQDRGISRLFVRIVNLFGTTFHEQFTEQTYKSFFEKLGYTDGTYDIVDGRMACDIAVFTKH